MVRFSKEREICIKRSLEQAFKERGKPVQSSLVKKFYKQFINLLNNSSEINVESYLEKLSKDVSGISNARFIINGNVEEARPDVVAGEIVATQIYLSTMARFYGYDAQINPVGFFILATNSGTKYCIRVNALLRYTINNHSLEEYLEKNELPDEIMKNEFKFLNIKKQKNDLEFFPDISNEKLESLDDFFKE